MNTIERLIDRYKQVVQLPWGTTLAGPQKVYFVIYDPMQERRIRLHIPDFASATTDAKHGWYELDLTNLFAEWMAGQEYREAYWESPADMDLALEYFADWLAERVRMALRAPEVDDTTVVALSGVGTLFGLTQVSHLVKQVDQDIRGRLLVFFPGEKNGSIYRFLDARDGWDYLAIAITATDES